MNGDIVKLFLSDEYDIDLVEYDENGDFIVRLVELYDFEITLKK